LEILKARKNEAGFGQASDLGGHILKHSRITEIPFKCHNKLEYNII